MCSTVRGGCDSASWAAAVCSGGWSVGVDTAVDCCGGWVVGVDTAAGRSGRARRRVGRWCGHSGRARRRVERRWGRSDRPLEPGHTRRCAGAPPAEIGAVASVGDFYDNALADSVIGLYRTGLIRAPTQGPWRSVDDVELATLFWVHWHNHQCLHSHRGDIPPTEATRAMCRSHLGDVPPAEFEAAYSGQRTAPALFWGFIDVSNQAAGWSTGPWQSDCVASARTGP